MELREQVMSAVRELMVAPKPKRKPVQRVQHDRLGNMRVRFATGNELTVTADGRLIWSRLRFPGFRMESTYNEWKDVIQYTICDGSNRLMVWGSLVNRELTADTALEALDNMLKMLIQPPTWENHFQDDPSWDEDCREFCRENFMADFVDQDFGHEGDRLSLSRAVGARLAANAHS